MSAPKSCAVCTRQYQPQRMGQRVCGPACAAKLVRRDKAAAKDARKDAVKTRRDWIAECQAVINAIARLRDRDRPCISCDLPAGWLVNGTRPTVWHASHYRSTAAASALRFNLWNIHKACAQCNLHKSGNLAGYRPRLIAKIGQDRVDFLEASNALVKFDVDYLRRLKTVMSKRLKRQERKQSNVRSQGSA